VGFRKRAGSSNQGSLDSANGIDDWVDPLHNDIMNARLTLDSAGRVVIPKGLRDELQLQPGDELDLETTGDEITLRPVRETPPLTKEQGVWVFRIGKPLPASATDETLRSLRAERDQGHLGPPK
jgi:AbrB family looped-hinge helix DNA binding protein